ncbi:hypothetical protein CI105_01880 [Candidatus Izimaplasma bacterium ZiA1]|uniref:membrane lipoprotein lipid attachment site-containing protein n=1 Tax=Candidatus Izimoplasma sp. ZiA1 TaxID=2024899 RepID=UPI000BAA53D7|nr:hypothetical protein CI105_01880 [Candidatus Izimaplasma bacterium ZiA1]
MKRIFILLIILFTLTGCKKADALSILTVDNLQFIQQIESNEFSIYNLLLINNEYQIEKYSTSGLFTKSYTFDLDAADVTKAELLYNDGVLAFVYYVEGKNKVYIKTLDKNLVLTNSLLVNYNNDLTEDDNQIYITNDFLYLANQEGITKYEYGSNVIKELLSYEAQSGKVFNIIVKDDIYLIVGVENKAFYYDDKLVQTKSERVLVKLNTSLEYIDKENLNDRYNVNGFKVEDDIYVYGTNKDNQVLVSKYDDSLELIHSASFFLDKNFVYELSGIQVDGDNVNAIIEVVNSRVGVYKLDLEKEEFKESFSKFFNFDFPEQENILGINNEYFIISDGYYLYMVETK